MNRITQEAKKRQGVVKLANRKGKSFASRVYGVSLASVKRWCKRYDGSWQSLAESAAKPPKEAQRGGGGDNKSGIQGEVLSIRVGRDICGSYQV